MIYWLIFDGGIGGDGFANMLEHANNIEPVDGDLKWRHERTPSGKIRFHYPVWVEPSQWFRYHDANFQYGIEELTEKFKSLMAKKANVVIPVHKTLFIKGPLFKFQELFDIESKQICLYSNDIGRVMEDFVDKQPSSEFSPEKVKKNLAIRNFRVARGVNNTSDLPLELMRDKTVRYIDIDRTWSDWEYLKENLDQLGIDLPREAYEAYLDVSERRK